MRVGEVAKYINGKAFKPSDWEADGRPIIRIQNLTRPDGPFNHTTQAVDPRFLVPPGTLLVSWSATLDVFEWRGREAVLNQHIFKVEPDDRLVGHRYLRWALANAIAEMRDGEHTHGTTMRHINRGPFLAHPLPLPPLPEQDRIVEAIEEQFSRLDAGVASLQRAKRNLVRMRASVLSAAVEGRLLEQDLGIAPVPGSPVADGLFKAPPSWVWSTVGEFCDVQGGIQKQPRRRPTKNAHPYLRVANVARNRLDLSEVHEIELFGNELERLRLAPGDLLVVEGNGSRDQIGRGALWRGEIADCVHQNHIIRVRPRSAVVPGFLLAYWNSLAASQELARIASSTSGLYTLSTAKVKSMPIVLPPIADQLRVVAEVERQSSILASMEAAVNAGLARAERLRQSILREAFAGRLVQQDPADEPASALLASIQSERNKQ